MEGMSVGKWLIQRATMQMVIDRLMDNDRNATWDECETVEELVEGLKQAIINTEDDEQIQDFYKKMLVELWEVIG